MNLKHSLSIGIAVGLVLGLSACGDGGSEPKVRPAESEAPAETGAGPSEEPSATEATVEDGTDPETPTDVVTPGPAEEEATSSPVPVEPSSSEFILVGGEVSVPAGEPDALGIALTGEYESNSGVLPVIVRNNTGETKHELGVSAMARDSGGDLAGSGSDQGLNPNVLQPGEWAFGYVFFGSDMPSDTSYEFTIDSSDAPSQFGGAVDLVPVESNSTEGTLGAQIIGVLSNATDETVSGPLGVSVACFDTNGTSLLDVKISFAEASELAPDGTTSFSVNLFDGDCANYAIGASGYTF